MVANKLLEHVLSALGGNGDSFNMSSAYLALSTTAPNKDGSNVTEPASTLGYQRSQLGGPSVTRYMGNPTYDASTGKYTITNTKEIHFNVATAGWGAITHFAIYTSSIGGTMYYSGSLPAAMNVAEGEVVVIKPGEITITLSAAELAA